MIKKIIVVFLAIFLVASCAGTTEEATPAPTVTKTVEVQAPEPAVDEYDMLDSIRAVSPEFWAVEDRQIIETAYMICATLRDGATAIEVAEVAESYLGTEAAVALVAGAVVYLCPDQDAKIRS